MRLVPSAGATQKQTWRTTWGKSGLDMANDGPNAANLEKHLRYLNEQEACVAVIVLVPQGNSFLYDKFFMQELTIIKRENLLSSKIHYVVGWHEYVEKLMRKKAKQASPHGRGLISTGKSCELLQADDEPSQGCAPLR